MQFWHTLLIYRIIHMPELTQTTQLQLATIFLNMPKI
jgi:predicted DNA-binding transcriptional regulator AlpA